MSDAEQALATEMTQMLQQKLESDYAKGSTLRDAHPKCLGLLKATFHVEPDLPKDHRVGVFTAPEAFPAFVRFSNASGSVQSDAEKDFRGIAIKLIGVAGERHSEDEQASQDFLLMNHPTMPLGTPKFFRDAIVYSLKWGPLVMLLRFLLGGRLSTLRTLAAGRSNPASLLAERYWSTTPYAFGDRVVKYQLRPLATPAQHEPAALAEDYLTQELASHLQAKSVRYEFGIQVFVDEMTTPIEDASVAWPETDAPFVRLAQLEFPQQTVVSDQRFALAEQLSFAPDNALAAHAPEGGLNRVRSVIYRTLSEFRHRRNEEPLIEPTADTYTDLT